MSNFKLTSRELEVLKLVARGYSYKKIAHILGRSERTVRNQMVTIRLKLRARNSSHAIAIVKDKGLI